MANKYYGIRDNWTDDDVANVVDITSEDGVITEVNVNGEPFGGGGGPSDFLVATATYTVEGLDSWWQLDKTWTEISNALTINPDSVFIIFGNTHFGMLAYRAYTNNYGIHLVECYTDTSQDYTISFQGDSNPTTPLKYYIY